MSVTLTPILLPLDEPTNNRDIYTIDWLAGVLNQRKSTMIIIPCGPEVNPQKLILMPS